jgi:hypothetical protein
MGASGTLPQRFRTRDWNAPGHNGSRAVGQRLARRLCLERREIGLAALTGGGNSSCARR